MEGLFIKICLLKVNNSIVENLFWIKFGNRSNVLKVLVIRERNKIKKDNWMKIKMEYIQWDNRGTYTR